MLAITQIYEYDSSSTFPLSCCALSYFYFRTMNDHAIIIEDDLELSPQWYSWLKRAWLSYGHRRDIAGIALSRQYMMVKVHCKNSFGINKSGF